MFDPQTLPDKELRYHRTVIVTAAVHRSLNPKLNPCGHHSRFLTYRHWAGVSPYTLPFGFAGTCVLDKQSLSTLLHMAPLLNGAGHLPKVTPRFFAEFLEHSSHDRLGLLDLPTCVGNAVRLHIVLLTNLFSQIER